MLRYLLLFLLITSTNNLFAFPRNLICTYDQISKHNGKTYNHKITINFISEDKAEFLTESKPSSLYKWSKNCWSNQTLNLTSENELYGDYACPAIRWSVLLTYLPSENSVRWHKRDGHPDFDKVYKNCESN